MYILIFRINNQCILSITEDGHVASYPTPEAILDAFRGYIDKFRPGTDYESYNSAGIGMMNINPLGVLFREDVSFLKDFILDSVPKMYTGLGFSSIMGVPIHSLILEAGEHVNIWRECMIAAGIYDPLQSDFQDPFKFSL